MTQKNPKKYKESFFNLHFTSTISISLVLFMVGIIVFLFQTTQYIAHKSKESVSLSICLDDSITTQEIERLNKYITAVPYINKIEYISKDSALQEHISSIGDDPTTLLGYNPLNASFEIYLAPEYANVDSITNIIIPKLSVFNGVNDIEYQKEMLQILNQNVNRLSIILTIIAIILLFISIVLINNTIRLSIYSKRFIINTMQLVGAKNKFIRSPFVKRAMINSITSSIIAIAALCGSIYFAQIQIGSTIDIYNYNIFVPIVGVVIILSFVINYLSTVIAVNHYLRMNTNQLYFI